MAAMGTERPTPDQILDRLASERRARFGSMWGPRRRRQDVPMLQDAHAFRREGVDVVIGLVETYGRADTDAQLKDIEVIPRRRVEYRGVVLEEMDLDAICAGAGDVRGR